MNGITVPILGFCAWSGTGKTTLLTLLLPLLTKAGLRVAVVKHAHHSFDIDHPGKDSYALRKAGASQMLIASRRRMALIEEFAEKRNEPSLAEAVAALNLKDIDLVLVEGFKHEAFQKIELHRVELKKPLLFPDDPNIIAVASDTQVVDNRQQLATLDINEPAQIAAFILDRIVGTPAAGNSPRPTTGAVQS